MTPAGFLALPPESSALDGARVALVPVPYDGAASYLTGARDGPRAIIEASKELEEYDVELGYEPCAVGIYTAGDVETHSAGPRWMVDRVQREVANYLDRSKVVGVLGGDHSVTVGSVRAMALRYRDLSVLYMDAHADLRDEYQGSAYNHACTARRISEVCPVVLVGLRSVAAEEREAITALSIPTFFRTAAPLGEEDRASVIECLTSHVYISVDLDVLDPSFMAAVGTPEPGGLGWWELLSLLRMVGQQRTVVGFDIMELTPREGPVACAYTAAKLAYKLIGYTT